MSFSPAKSTSVSLWLFMVLLRLGLPQDVPTNSQVESPTVATHGDIIMPTYVRSRRALPSPQRPCIAPPQPANGEYKLHRDQCDSGMSCTIPEGTELQPGSQLVYSCHIGYKLKENPVVSCNTRGRWSPIQACIEIGCASLSSASTMVTCYRKAEWVHCDSMVPPGTEAELQCQNGYRKDSTVMTRTDKVVCSAEGVWEPNPIRCVSVCGEPNTHMAPLMIGGTFANISDFPWHASLHQQEYSITKKKNIFVFRCGATIIHTHFLVTAAHCVYDETNKVTKKPEELFVITGNTFVTYDYPYHHPTAVKKPTVKSVHVYCRFLGLIGNYGSDIALLELEQPLEFSSILIPICLDDSGYSEQILQSGAQGKVPGFGRTAKNKFSGSLQTMTLPYIPYDQCKSSHNADKNQAFIGVDKFCAGYNNGSALCEGDSGGGLVFRRGNLWYLMGIVSVGLGASIETGERKCDEYSYSLYTRVSSYMWWIKDMFYAVENGKAIRKCIINRSTCLAPSQPANGEWWVHEDPCSRNDCKKPEGTVFQNSRQLNYTCDPGFTLKGNKLVTCRYDGQWTPIPMCTPIPDTPCGMKRAMVRSGLEMRRNVASDDPSVILPTSVPIHVKNRWEYGRDNITWRDDPCSLTDGSTGTCILLTRCQPVLDELKLGKLPEKQCGFSGDVPIVCCPISNAVTTTTPLPVYTEDPITTTASLPDDTEDPMSDEIGVIARQKCKEYSEYVYAWDCPPVVADSRLPVNILMPTGKTKVERMEFPHMVAVGYNLKNGDIGWYSGGTLISETFVLTAAHCTFKPDWGSATWVRLGDLNLVRSDDGARPIERRIIERIRHPEYKPDFYYHDIALLRMATSVSFNGWIRPACLHTAPIIRNEEAIAAGWGRVDSMDDKTSGDLMKVTLPLVDTKTCKAKWTSNSVNTKLPRGIMGDRMICAGAEGKDTCGGDSGGPMFILCNNQTEYHCMYDVVGVTGFGKVPCGSGIPGIYTRVYYHLSWIESTVWGAEGLSSNETGAEIIRN